MTTDDWMPLVEALKGHKTVHIIGESEARSLLIDKVGLSGTGPLVLFCRQVTGWGIPGGEPSYIDVIVPWHAVALVRP